MTLSPVDYDAELARYSAVLRGVWAIQPGARILDVGCGSGQTTREAARAAPAGIAVGVDIRGSAIERARLLTRAEGPPNASFEQADAQTHAFTPGGFDLAVSRFGTMFFADPVAAFANIGRALRPSGRLVMLVWQAGDRNEWDVVIRRALAGDGRAERDVGEGSDAFSLSDPVTVERTLEAAGFVEVGLDDLREPVYYGSDTAAALSWVRGFASTTALLDRLDPAPAADALARLQDALAAHQGDDGVWLGARAWLVTARRR